jgi:4-amino-4-deoxy-L-arabinose transferase-like glycosyltransferase
MKLADRIKKAAENRLVYAAIVMSVVLLFLVQAFLFAHRLPSRVDEGSFLVKGYYFISGRYQPFADYGPWTNNMPLAYWIPGIPQALFGPSLLVGRYFAIFAALLTLTGIWTVIRRLAGKWWAVLAAAALALSPAWIATNVQAVSQVLVACQVAWLLVFLLGDERADWQIALAALLSASVTLTRQNMVFMMAFVVLYTWWQHGFKKALLALAFAAVPFIALHALYYPRIMQLWYTWLPSSLRRIFNVGLIQGGGEQVWRPDGDLVDRISSFFLTLRYYFIPLFGSFLAVPLLFNRDAWRSRFEYRTMVSLAALFYILFILHAWASLSKNYCIFCFSNYVDFFLPIAAVLTALTLRAVFSSRKKLPAIFALLLLVVLVPGLFFASADTVGRFILALPVPRIKGGSLVGGTTILWELIRNRFGLAYDQILLVVPPLAGLFFIILFFVILLLAYRLGKRSKSFWSFFFSSVVVAAMLLTPSGLLGAYSDQNACNGDALAAYESAGRQLEASIPQDASVYWGSGSVVTPLLYIADKGIQPLQLNGIYPKRDGGDRDTLEKYGYYNAESVRDWRDTADYILVQRANMLAFWDAYLNPEQFDEIGVTVPIDPCNADSAIKIFRRK